MSKIHKSIYEKGSVEKFFRNLTDLLNKLSADPLNEELNTRCRIPFFPLSWDLSQYYYLLKELYRTKLFDHMAFIIANRDYSKIHEIFMYKFIKTDEIEEETGQYRYKFEVISFPEDEHKDAYVKIYDYMKTFDVKIFKYLEDYFKEKFDFELGHLFIMPEHIAHVGTLADTDYINSDVVRYLKDFIGLLRRGMLKRDKIEPKYMPVIQFSSKKNRANPIVNLFIKFAMEWADVEVDKFMDFLVSFLESTSLNILLLNEENNPITISRILVENEIIHFNPVPLKFLKKYLIANSEYSVGEITKTLYSYTKTKTLPIKIEDITKLMIKFDDPEYSYIDSVLDIIQFIYNDEIYPESILSQLLSNLGINCSKAIPRLKDTFVSFVKYYNRILVAVLIVNENKRELASLFSISMNNGKKLKYDQIPENNYKSIFEENKTPEAINILEEKIRKDTNMQYPFIAVIKMNVFKDIFSIKNLESLMEMIKFKNNLPSLERLAAVIRNISESENKIADKKIKKETISIKEKKKPVRKKGNGGLLDELPSLDHFLTKGITLKIAKGKSFIFSRDNQYSEKGYLGLDIKRLREFIKNNFPEILE